MTNACDRRDPYNQEELGLLRRLKQSHPRAHWRELITMYNASVPKHRQRTKNGLLNKWKDMQHSKKEEKLLAELKIAHPHADWQDLARWFNEKVPAHRNIHVETLRLKWENIQLSSCPSLPTRPPDPVVCTFSPSTVSIQSESSVESSSRCKANWTNNYTVDTKHESSEDRRAALENERWYQIFYDTIDPDMVPGLGYHGVLQA
ncbi:hypothetical protein ACJ73_05102 [Blastomyces percursus]|uniref:Myb-like domain-containing protein n=1 Tax=Blastomyces percursus TaxID=1658174 RepID=A0A1J9Q4R6_9EURO|nr:hypothetical protein ACJ73_05102 [Blastomyces percursus]